MATAQYKVIDSETYQGIERSTYTLKKLFFIQPVTVFIFFFKAYQNISGTLYQLCDNSSSGMFYVQEDIRMSIPKIVKSKVKEIREHHNHNHIYFILFLKENLE